MKYLLALALFTATWQRPNVARLNWTQPAGVHETCLVKNTTLIGCWYDLPAGLTGLSLGATGPMDANYRPVAGDVFTLAYDGNLAGRAPLRSVVYLGVIRG